MLLLLSCFSHVRLFVTRWAVARQAPLSMGIPQQEYWSRLPCPPPGRLPDLGIKPTSPVSPALHAGEFFTCWAIGETQEHWSGSLSLLQGIVPTQELNQGLLYCKQILCQLSYQGSPLIFGKARSSKICRSDYTKCSEQKCILKGATECQRITMMICFTIWYTKAL